MSSLNHERVVTTCDCSRCGSCSTEALSHSEDDGTLSESQIQWEVVDRVKQRTLVTVENRPLVLTTETCIRKEEGEAKKESKQTIQRFL